MNATHTARIRLWSEIGHTPITGRGGSFCDELADFTVAVVDYKDAIDAVRSAICRTRYASRGHVSIPDLPHPGRSQWADDRECNPDPRGC